ncbi:hypothetical protein ACQUJS_10735 [Ralstonia pseudosolanacearum]|nr:hypothetical protein RSP799_04925 [Ralstonia solanacearum]
MSQYSPTFGELSRTLNINTFLERFRLRFERLCSRRQLFDERGILLHAHVHMRDSLIDLFDTCTSPLTRHRCPHDVSDAPTIFTTSLFEDSFAAP